MKDLYHIFRAYNNTNFIIQQILKYFIEVIMIDHAPEIEFPGTTQKSAKNWIFKRQVLKQGWSCLGKKKKKKKKKPFFSRQKKTWNPRFGLHIRYVTINWQLRQFSCRPSLLLTSIFHLNNRPIIFLGVKEAWKLYVFILQNITIGDNTLWPNIQRLLTPLHILRRNNFFHF